jgi:hypothetical protein
MGLVLLVLTIKYVKTRPLSCSVGAWTYMYPIIIIIIIIIIVIIIIFTVISYLCCIIYFLYLLLMYRFCVLWASLF